MNSKDGVVQSEFILRTKLGDEFKIMAYESQKEKVAELVEAIVEKKPLVFPSQDNNGRLFIMIIAADLVADIRVWEFSHIVQGHNKKIAERKIQ